MRPPRLANDRPKPPEPTEPPPVPLEPMPATEPDPPIAPMMPGLPTSQPYMLGGGRKNGIGVGCAIGGISVGQVMRTIAPFYGALGICLMLVTYVPAPTMTLVEIFYR